MRSEEEIKEERHRLLELQKKITGTFNSQYYSVDKKQEAFNELMHVNERLDVLNWVLNDLWTSK